MNKPAGARACDEQAEAGKRELISIGLELTISVSYDDEIDEYVSYCPALELYSQGSTQDGAISGIQEAITMFLWNCYERGTLNQVLHESGFMAAHAHKDERRPSLILEQREISSAETNAAVVQGV